MTSETELAPFSCCVCIKPVRLDAENIIKAPFRLEAYHKLPLIFDPNISCMERAQNSFENTKIVEINKYSYELFT